MSIWTMSKFKLLKILTLKSKIYADWLNNWWKLKWKRGAEADEWGDKWKISPKGWVEG